LLPHCGALREELQPMGLTLRGGRVIGVRDALGELRVGRWRFAVRAIVVAGRRWPPA
jgi:hypothetical protein